MRKLFSAILIAALLVTSAVPVFGATSPEARELENAIRQVRAVIDISSDATVFEHSSWEDGAGGRTWNLLWRNDDWSIMYNVSIDATGRIISFFVHNRDIPTGVGDLNREQGRRIAETFLGRVVPASITDFRLIESFAELHSFSFSFGAYKNDFPVRDWIFHVTVDKASERVTSYFGGFGITDELEFAVPSEMISAAEAKAALIENESIYLIYSSFFDWSSRETRVFPAFILDSQSFVDAGTGEILLPPHMFFGVHGPVGAGLYFGMLGDTAEDERQVNLTPVEQGAVDGLTGIITREQAARTATDAVPTLSASAELMSASLSTRHDDRNRHMWVLHFENNVTAVVDAHDNRLLSFSDFSQRDMGTNIVSAETAERTARDFMRRVAPREMEQTVFFERTSTTEIQPLAREQGVLYRFVFAREVNGVPFPGNSISASVDPTSGRIVHFDLTWNTNITFPPIGETISAEEAFDVFAESINFGLFYTMVGDNEMKLVYGFRSGAGFTVDPRTGGRIGHDGNAFIEHTRVTSYDDIEGRWYESAVNALLDMGHFLEGTSFNGSAQITQEEFLRFLFPNWGGTSRDDFYNWMVSSGIILRDEVAPYSAITRQEAARIAIRFLGLQRAARDSSIFVNPFADAVSDNFLGYAALARALGVMTGDTAGNFNGAQNMTRAQAAVVINNLLRVQ